jgi:hypothetical protein
MDADEQEAPRLGHEVAGRYRIATPLDGSPTVAVVVHLRASRSTAHRRIAGALGRQLLAPALCGCGDEVRRGS